MESKQTPSDSGSQKSSDTIVSVCFCASACLWVCAHFARDVTWTCLCGGHNASFSSSPDTKERSLAASFSRGHSLPSCVSVEETMLCCNHFMPGPDAQHHTAGIKATYCSGQYLSSRLGWILTDKGRALVKSFLLQYSSVWWLEGILHQSGRRGGVTREHSKYKNIIFYAVIQCLLCEANDGDDVIN